MIGNCNTEPAHHHSTCTSVYYISRTLSRGIYVFLISEFLRTPANDCASQPRQRRKKLAQSASSGRTHTRIRNPAPAGATEPRRRAVAKRRSSVAAPAAKTSPAPTAPGDLPSPLRGGSASSLPIWEKSPHFPDTTPLRRRVVRYRTRRVPPWRTVAFLSVNASSRGFGRNVHRPHRVVCRFANAVSRQP